MNATHASRKTVRWSFIARMVSVGSVYLLHDLSGAHFLPGKWLVGCYAVVGLITLNIVVFIITLLRSLWEARKVAQRDAPEEEKEREVEELMVPALQGRAEPPEAASWLMEIPLGVAVGLVCGTFLAGAVLLVLRWAGLQS